MDWLRIAPAFKPDGFLRDIYIFDTSLMDWERVWEILLADPHRLSFSVDGEITAPPADAAEVFRLGQAHSVCASLALGKQRLNCHFFTEEEVEFDLDPRDVRGPSEAERLEQFLAELGRTTAKEVRLTPESGRHLIIARFDPAVGQVEWMPWAA